MEYTFNFWHRIWGKILYCYGMLWYPLFKLLPFNMGNKFFVFVLKQFGSNCRNPYYEITKIEKRKRK